jgi:hypothetical protein
MRIMLKVLLFLGYLWFIDYFVKYIIGNFVPRWDLLTYFYFTSGFSGIIWCSLYFSQGIFICMRFMRAHSKDLPVSFLKIY